MRTAICPGSFDPITRGHLNIIKRTRYIFDDVIVLVMSNSNKPRSMFNLDERVNLVKKCLIEYPEIKVETYNGLLAEYTKRFAQPVLVKGLRASMDFENEFQMAQLNKKMHPELETMFLMSGEKYTFLSSSMVRELALYGADLTELLPREVIGDVEAKAKMWREKNGQQ